MKDAGKRAVATGVEDNAKKKKERVTILESNRARNLGAFLCIEINEHTAV